jgi:hypothetical protein
LCIFMHNYNFTVEVKSFLTTDKKTVKHTVKTKGCTLNKLFSYTKIVSCCFAIWTYGKNLYKNIANIF